MNPYMNGFAKLRPGRIHAICPTCKRKASNAGRADYDPKRAVVVVVPCDRCSMGCKVDGPDGYWDKRGRWLSDKECEIAAGIDAKELAK